jgi:aspartyl-tRNA(Asn)/glutamyl-tRNA(Gln) amidotransferase subunit A
MVSKQLILDRLNDYSLKKEQHRDINCITNDLYDRAINNYKNFTESQINGPLSGKLFAVKDNINIKGLPTTCASNILKTHCSIYTSTAVKKIEKAGGLIVAKTNLDEFGMGSSNEHSIFGTSKNPSNLNYVCGGSSGGSAGIVSAGVVDVALGSDTGGSVRQPASFCGIYGLKPTYGRISRYGLTAFASSFDQIGILSKKLDDLISTFQIISGSDTNDSTTSNREKISLFEVVESFVSDPEII